MRTFGSSQPNKYHEVRSVIDLFLFLNGMTKGDLAKAVAEQNPQTHLGRATLFRKLADPRLFNLGDFDDIAGVLGTEPEVLTGTRQQAFEWLAERGRTPTDDGGGSSQCAPWDLNPEPADYGCDTKSRVRTLSLVDLAVAS